MQTRSLKAALVAILTFFVALSSFAATVSTRHEARSNRKIKESANTERRMAASRHSRAVRSRVAQELQGKSSAVVATGKRGKRKARYYERFTATSFASDPAAGDNTAGEDPMVREAAINALGNLNGTVVAIDPSNGRILAMVNQKLALSSGAEPCSTIKVSVALAALSEGIVTKDTPVNLGGWKVDMNQALAHSNNQYFEALGRRLGFQKVSYYAHQFGLGELAGWNLEGEHLGVYPSEELPAKLGGVGKMCSFGESVSMTPLQLGSLMAAIANGGTLVLPAASALGGGGYQLPAQGQALPGYRAVDSRSQRGHVGCNPVRYRAKPAHQLHLGAGAGQDRNLQQRRNPLRLVRFVRQLPVRPHRHRDLPQGDHAVYGPKAAELAGHFYHNLDEHNYFAGKAAPVRSAALLNKVVM